MSTEQQQTNETKSGEDAGKQQEAAAAEQPPVKEMRAVVLTSFGGLKSVKVLKKPEPSPAAGEVLIRVKTCGVGFPDLMLRQGCIDGISKPPLIMGFECAGVIESVGEGVTGFEAGDRVAALTDMRAWAELVSVPEKHVYKLPSKMKFEDATALTLNGVVAVALLFDVANVKPGQTVLVHSIGGGVGQTIAQLAKTIANVTLIGTASKSKHESLTGVANHILDTQDYVQEVKKIAPEGVDVVLDCLCGEDANRGYNLLKPMGRYVLYGTSFIVAGETKSIFTFAKSWWQVDKVSPMKLFEESKTLSGFHLRHLLYQQDRHDYVRSLVAQVYKFFEEGKLRPVIDSTWALEDIAEAMQKIHERKNIGKILLDPAAEPKPQPQPETEADKKRKGSAKETTNASNSRTQSADSGTENKANN